MEYWSVRWTLETAKWVMVKLLSKHLNKPTRSRELLRLGQFPFRYLEKLLLEWVLLFDLEDVQ